MVKPNYSTLHQIAVHRVRDTGGVGQTELDGSIPGGTRLFRCGGLQVLVCDYLPNIQLVGVAQQTGKPQLPGRLPFGYAGAVVMRNGG